MTETSIALPCRVGDLVWGIRRSCHAPMVAEGPVTEMYFADRDMRLGIRVRGVCVGEWGKTVFATRSEAEAAKCKLKKELQRKTRRDPMYEDHQGRG